ncbi:hypothetical protein HMN09_01125400 [Mycena chlorophos]|uniref:Uncharacterized protein n=1 Tax=Mycena chlorophos TaxID=658473 RepID=A0A8H6SBD6_MYCCL|nr:hypothetical protein HMN09_01125400 [Mycena chlorophos]
MASASSPSVPAAAATSPPNVSVPLLNIINAFGPETRPLARKYLNTATLEMELLTDLRIVCALEGFNVYYHILAHSLLYPERDIPAHLVLTDAFAFLPRPAEDFARAHVERFEYHVTECGDLHVRALPPDELHFSALLAAIQYGDALLDAERARRNVQKSLGTGQSLHALEEYMRHPYIDAAEEYDAAVARL